MNYKRQSKSVGYAIAGLVFGVFGLMLFWLPFVGAVISFIALALATVGLIINLQEVKKEIVVYIALGISLIAAALSGKITYKTTQVVNDIVNSETFHITKKIFNGATVYQDSNSQDVHIVIRKEDLDSANKKLNDLENIIEELDSTNDNFH